MWRRSLDRLYEGLLYVAGAAMLLMMLHVVLDVGAKYLLDKPIPQTLETVSYYYMVAVLFLPFAYVARTEGHIQVELFTRGLKPRALAWFEVAVGLVTLLAMVVFTWRTGLSALDKTTSGEFRDAAEGIIIVWPSRWILPVGGAAMALAVLVRLIDDLRRAVGANDDTDGSA